MADLIRFKRGLDANIPALMVGEPGWSDDTEELYVGSSNGNVLINPTQQLNGNLLQGKNVLILGDSISVAGDTNWTNYLTTKYGAIVTNPSFSGQTITGTSGWGSAASAITGTYDFIILFCGTNDYGWQRDPGTCNSFDQDTFNGAIRNLCTIIETKWPTARTFFCSPVKRNVNPSTIYYSMAMYQMMLKSNANRWGFSFIDLFQSAPHLVPILPNNNARWYQDADGLHPNAAYMPILADYIASQINCNSNQTPSSQAQFMFANTVLGGNIYGYMNSSGVATINTGYVATTWNPTTTGGNLMLIATLPTYLTPTRAIYAACSGNNSVDDTFKPYAVFTQGTSDVFLSMSGLTAGMNVNIGLNVAFYADNFLYAVAASS